MISNSLRAVSIFSAVLVLVACGGGEESTPADQAGATAPTPAPTPANLSAADLAGGDRSYLVPSPGEMQRALESAGIESSLATLVPVRELDMAIQNKDQVAVRTGVVLADVLLTLRSAETADTVGRLQAVRDGLGTLQAGDDLPAELDDLIANIQNTGVTDRLVFELDELSAAVIPEIQYEAEWILPLIQAGAWLEGANLVSTAIKASGDVSASNNLLIQPQVVDYFLHYVEQEGQKKVDSVVLQQLLGTLGTLKTICESGDITSEDLDTIQSTTSSVLQLL